MALGEGTDMSHAVQRVGSCVQTTGGQSLLGLICVNVSERDQLHVEVCRKNSRKLQAVDIPVQKLARQERSAGPNMV
jgi:hypothetical protein